MYCWVKSSLAQKAFIFFREIITNPNKEYKVKSKTIECIVEIVREKPSLVQEIFTFLKMLIINSAVNYNLKLKIINSIVEIVEITPSLAYEVFTFLNAEATITKSIAKRVKIKPIKKTLPFIVDVKTDEYIKADAFESITNIVKAKPSLAQEIFTLSILITKQYKFLLHNKGKILVPCDWSKLVSQVSYSQILIFYWLSFFNLHIFCL